MIRLLTIGTDRSLFQEGSAVARRIIRQSEMFHSHIIIICTTRTMPFSRVRLSPRLEVIPTRSVSKLLCGFDALRIAFKEGRKTRISLVSTQDPFETGLAGLLASFLLRVPLQVQVHTDFLSPHFARLSFLNQVRVVLADIIIPRARAIRTVSRRTARSIEDRYKLKRAVAVLPVFSPSEGAVHIPRETFGFKRMILAASRLEREKDVALALKSFACLRGDFPGVGLVIAGEGREKPALKAQAVRLGIDSSVAFVGWRKDLPALLSHASVFLNASRFEGYGLTLLEAARAGCPIVTTDVGLVGELIEDGDAEIVPVGDAHALTRGISRVLSDEARARSRTVYLRAKALQATISEDAYLQRLQKVLTDAIA